MDDILKAMRPRTYRTKSGSTYTVYPFEGSRVRVVGDSVTLGRIELVGEVVQEPDPDITTGPLSHLVVRIDRLIVPANAPNQRFLHTSPAKLVETAEITEEEFEKATGSLPVMDDLCRANCKFAGEPGHWQCGWCGEHNLPRFMCGCMHKVKSA